MPRKKKYRVLITASGVGSPLGDITKFTNKALIKIGRKPTISYIIEAYPKDTEYVITTGYFGDQVKDFLTLVYPERHFTFVDVDKYEGEGSSLAYSMLQAARYLQDPFVYHASDTIVTDPIPYPEENWIGGYSGEGSSNYASFDMIDGRVQGLRDKGTALKPDYLHIGLVGVKDYRKFWEHKKKLVKEQGHLSHLGDMHTINNMIEEGVPFTVYPVKTWYDTGNTETLARARAEIEDSFHILDKLGESIFIFDNFVVKFFHDEKMVADRLTRASVLEGLVPEIEDHRKNFYRYRFVDGDLYADVATRSTFRDFLSWAKQHLWKQVKEVDKKEFHAVCHDFYHTKTRERLEKFFKTRALQDQPHVINEVPVPSVEELLGAIDFTWLCQAEQSHFHGDFILDNIIKTADGFRLLDWRQNFGGLLKAGDLYYDLAKLNHNLTVNHGIINDNLFTVKVAGNRVTCDILRKQSLVECQEILFAFLGEEGYDRKKVRVLTALIWLNMAPLHHHPFDLFLYYFGKLNLWRALYEE
jgi:dTDP-glucose pyrophosphorylase